MTVQRPGQAADLPDRPAASSRRQVPTAAKLLAAVLAIAVVAAVNVTAAHRQRRRDRAVANRVVAAAVISSTDVAVGSAQVDITLAVTNSGAPVLVRTAALTARGYTLVPTSPLPVPVGRGGVRYLTVRIQAPCGDAQAAAGRGPAGQLSVQVAAAAGPLRELAVPAESFDLRPLTQRACGFVAPDQAAHLKVTQVQPAGGVAVTFRLTLTDSSRRPFSVRALAAEGLAFSVTGGLPVTVAAGGRVALAVRLRVAACVQLPNALDLQRTDSLPFAAFELEVQDGAGRPFAVDYLTDAGTPFYDAIRTLARRQCPQAFYSVG